jgi:hypothetical protein
MASLERVALEFSMAGSVGNASEPAGLNHRLTIPAHSRYYLLAEDDPLVVTIEPSLIRPSGGFLVGRTVYELRGASVPRSHRN